MLSDFHFEVAGYFSIPDFTTLFGKWLSQELPGSSKIQNVKNIFTATPWECLWSVTCLRLSLTRSCEIQHPGQRRSTLGVWANKAFFVLSCQAEKRDHLRLPGGALRLHIFICLTYLSSLADIHADSVQTSTRLENNRRWVEVSLNEGVYCW